MYLIITRSFPPEVGGMQSLMGGLAKSLSKHDLTKVFADYTDEHKQFDDNVSFSVERIAGAKFFRKLRKSYLINDYLKKK